MAYNSHMDKDEALQEFVQILGRIKELLGEAAIQDGEGIDLAGAIEKLRKSGSTAVADELEQLCKRADDLKAQHQAQS